MKGLSNIIKAVFFIGILMSCNHKADYSDIVGVWKCDVAYDNMTGQEWITCMEDSSVTVMDSLLYSIEEDSLKIDVKCSVANYGEWALKDNELNFRLRNFVVEIDSSSLKVSAQSHEFSIDTINSNYIKFKQELFEQVKSDVSSYFKTGVNRDITIGRIKEFTEATLVVENSSGKLILERVPKSK